MMFCITYKSTHSFTWDDYEFLAESWKEAEERTKRFVRNNGISPRCWYLQCDQEDTCQATSQL